jgi:hypothetical protein
MTRNNDFTETGLLDLVLSRLRERLPTSWGLKAEIQPAARVRPDALLEIRDPSGATGTVAVEIIGPRTAPYLRYVLEIMQRARSEMPNSSLMAGAPYFSPTIRVALTRDGIGYADATGNFRLTLEKPALFIELTGADRDPWPDDQPLRSLRGSAAGRAVRAYCDFRPPYGIRELAERSGVPAPTLSRVAKLFEREGILRRERNRGPVVAVDWPAALRRWTQDYSFVRSNRTSNWLEPRGLQALMAKLRDAPWRYAVTGSLIASSVAPIAAPRLAAFYVQNVNAAAADLGLREAETGANVIVADPFDSAVFARGFDRDGVKYVAYTQAAADLMTGPGRWPAEGEALMRWMEANEPAWRA